MLYGIDLAKREMTKTKQVVIVEGYTDVMAAHLAGIKTAVATCGTAFGAGHIKVVRRMITDDGSGGEIIFTFDGDAAGQKAALAAFEEDQRFVAQTYVAVAQEGMDPCDLRLHRGDAAVRSLIASRRPLFEFVIDTTLKRFDLTTLEGRVLAMRAIAPIIAGIRDRDLRPAYMRKVSGQLGMELEEIQRAVAYAQRHPQQKNVTNRWLSSPKRPGMSRYLDTVSRLRRTTQLNRGTHLLETLRISQKDPRTPEILCQTLTVILAWQIPPGRANTRPRPRRPRGSSRKGRTRNRPAASSLDERIPVAGIRPRRIPLPYAPRNFSRHHTRGLHGSARRRG